MDQQEAGDVIAAAIHRVGASQVTSASDLLVLCIGSDRSIGDALGPLVGTHLEHGGNSLGYTVLGTLDRPVHASNLAETLVEIKARYRNPLILAVDACLGRSESVGFLTVGRGSLRPGAGVNKSLPAVGDLYLTGVVNVGGFMEYFVLQNTRLSLVMRMARCAAVGIHEGMTTLARCRRLAELETRMPSPHRLF